MVSVHVAVAAITICGHGRKGNLSRRQSTANVNNDPCLVWGKVKEFESLGSTIVSEN